MDWEIFDGRVSIVCIGNELNGDDALGREVSIGLSGLDGIQVIWAHTAPENFTDEIAGYGPSRVILVDAADFGGHPGEIRLMGADILQQAHVSTHRAPLRLLRGLFLRKGLELYLVGVQAANGGLGQPLSVEVSRAAKRIVDEVKRRHTGGKKSIRRP